MKTLHGIRELMCEFKLRRITGASAYNQLKPLERPLLDTGNIRARNPTDTRNEHNSKASALPLKKEMAGACRVIRRKSAKKN